MSEDEKETESCSPIVIWFTEQELRGKTVDYLTQLYGKPGYQDEEAQDRWFQRSGLLLGFVANLFDPEMFNAESSHARDER